MDQKANSIADLAAVLALQKKGPSQEHVESANRTAENVRTQKARGKKTLKRKDPQGPVMGGVEGVKVRWVNLLDAEFAEKWPDEVVHDGLTRHRYAAALPLIEEGSKVAEATKEIAEVPVALLEAGSKAETGIRA